VPALRLAGKQIGELVHRFTHHLGILDNGRHVCTLRGPRKPSRPGPGQNASIRPQIPHFSNAT
jgi:hypothetical protein